MNLSVYIHQVYLPENGTTVYDTLPLSVNKLYIFTDKIEKLNIDDVKILADVLVGTGGVVLVDVYVYLSTYFLPFF
jgi:hypothetical protein